jgi:hypothetical protein
VLVMSEHNDGTCFMPLDMPDWIERLELALANEEASNDTSPGWYFSPREALALNGTESAHTARGETLALYSYQLVIAPHGRTRNCWTYGYGPKEEVAELRLRDPYISSPFDKNTAVRHRLRGPGIPLDYWPPLPTLLLPLSPIKTAALLVNRLETYSDSDSAQTRIDPKTAKWLAHAKYFLELAKSIYPKAWRELDRPDGLRPAPSPLPKGATVRGRMRCYFPPSPRSDSPDSQETITDQPKGSADMPAATSTPAPKSRRRARLSFLDVSLQSVASLDTTPAARRAWRKLERA